MADVLHSPDSNTSTRETWTQAMILQAIPHDAAPQWTGLFSKHQRLLRCLAYHPAMAPNMSQTYETPAASKNKVYFAWDFVGRTLGMIGQVPHSMSGLNSEQQAMWSDAMGRAVMIQQLILDTQPGMLDMMTESTYPDQTGRHPEFGDEVLEAASALV